MDKMDIWNESKQVPPTYLKPIQAGRLKGKTDINPTWRMLKLTELFGPVGLGWYYEPRRYWTEASQDTGELMVFVEINLFIKYENEWSAPIYGVGGHKLIEKESKGPYANDEAVKMATTDALSVACKALGIGADIYFNLWDGSKYKTVPTTSGGGSSNPKPTFASNDQVKTIHTLFPKAFPEDYEACGRTEDFDAAWRDFRVSALSKKFGREIKSVKELTTEEASITIDGLKLKAEGV